jgi:ATP phosphoribosyltransferase regulatory subunit
MQSFIRKLPEGVQDFLPDECEIKKDLEAQYRELYRSNGLLEVETPTFEYYDVFSNGVGAYTQEHMIKFFDLNGRILVLKPDTTVPIARIASTALTASQLRLFYIQNAYAVNDINIDQRSEFTQAGVEFIGKSGSGADAEVIAIAISQMKESGLINIKLELGQAAYFKGIIEDAEIEPEEADALRRLIDSKNTVELEYLLNNLHMDATVKKRLLSLPSLFGGKEVIERARKLANTPRCEAALSNLEQVYNMLSSFGYEKYLTIDLGMLHKMDYYSGIIFRGICDDMGSPILSGGRYDMLFANYGSARPAVGFALGINRVMLALHRQGNLPKRTERCALVLCAQQKAKEGYEYAAKLRGQGMPVRLEIDLPDQEAEEMAGRYNPVYRF